MTVATNPEPDNATAPATNVMPDLAAMPKNSQTKFGPTASTICGFELPSAWRQEKV
jgi:hypothetical protein